MRDFKLFKLYDYLNEDGTFNYDKYKEVQVAKNKHKIKSVWVSRHSVEKLSKYIKSLIPNPEFGLCHGTRRGKEQFFFSKFLDCNVLGTEISDTAERFPNTIEWDFHEVKDEWIEAVDFIYSNSFDHTYDPKKCMNAWMSCLKKGGLCIIEHHSVVHTPPYVSEGDPFGAYVFIMPYLITVWGNGRYGVRRILNMGERGKSGVSLQL